MGAKTQAGPAGGMWNDNDDLRLRSRLREAFVTTSNSTQSCTETNQPISPSQLILFYLFLPISIAFHHSVFSRGETRSRFSYPPRYATRAIAAIMTLSPALSEPDVEAFLQKLKAAGELQIWVLSLRCVLG
jgi:hypothetical protein